MTDEETPKFRFMLEMPNKVKIYSSDEALLDRVLEKCGMTPPLKGNDEASDNLLNVSNTTDKVAQSISESKSETQPASNLTEHSSKDEVVEAINDFIKKNNRPPKRNEPGFDSVVYKAEKVFGSWEKALNGIYGMTYREWREQNGLLGTIRKLLDHNPLTLSDLKAELLKNQAFSGITTARIFTTINQSKDLESTGVHGHKLYYIKGQEPSVDTHPEINRLDRSQVEEELFKLLVVPMTKTQIVDHFNQSGNVGFDNMINSSLHKFWREERVWRVQFVAGAGSGQKHSAIDLFGSLAGKMVFCRKDCPGAFATFIHEHIEIKEESSRGFNRALTIRLKGVLPREVIDLI